MYKNQEGYCDPTAGKAIQDASRIPHHVKEAHKALKDIASLLGFEVLMEKARLQDMIRISIWRSIRQQAVTSMPCAG